MKRKISLFEMLGILLVIVGLSGGFFFWKTTYAESAADGALSNQASQIQEDWNQSKPESKPSTTEEAVEKEPPAPVEGETIGVLHVPKWGKDHAVPIIHGVRDEDLENGVGKYTDSSTPGKLGNMALAGHRSGDPQPFRNLLKLEKGDKVIVETQLAKYIYTVTKPAHATTVKAQDGGWVVHSPEIEKAYEKSTITLITCTHLYRSDDRSILFGELEKIELK